MERIRLTCRTHFFSCRERAPASAKAVEAPGLVRKYYLLSADGATAGGAYLWGLRDAADHMCAKEWRQHIARTYGAEPRVAYFEIPVVVDYVAGCIEKR